MPSKKTAPTPKRSRARVKLNWHGFAKWMEIYVEGEQLPKQLTIRQDRHQERGGWLMPLKEHLMDLEFVHQARRTYVCAGCYFCSGLPSDAVNQIIHRCSELLARTILSRVRGRSD